MSTKGNVLAAFAGESQANRKYLAFAKKAEEEGYKQVAKLFRATADAETVHAHSHLRVANGIKTTKENLAEAVAGENHEFMNMYPAFIKEAQDDGNKAAELSFKNAMAVEKIHHNLYSKASAAVSSAADLPSSDIYVCQICGYTIEGNAPEKCPICGAPKIKFTKIL